MKLSLLTLAMVGCTGCPPNQPAVVVTDQEVYQALVTDGCLQASDGGVQAVHDEHALPTRPAWVDCMYTPGGSVQSCAVPCDGGGK